jgi:hypothetical protein
LSDTPDIQKHFDAQIVRLMGELATAKALIEVLEKSLAEAKASRGAEIRNGAQSADGPVGASHGS